MRNISLLILLFIGLNGSAQKMNKFGKIVIDELPKAPEYTRIKNDNNYQIIYKDSLTFEGNEFYKLTNAFIANDETADNRPDKINYYGSDGKLKVSVITSRIINFKVSAKGNFAAFYNQKNILLINLNSFTIDTLYGSHSFAFTNEEKLIYFDSEERIIVYNEQVYSCDEFPSMFLEYNSNLLAFTSSKIIQLSGSDFITAREFEGVFHDARIIDNFLFLVEKTVKRKNIFYTLYKTSNLIDFEIVEKTDYM